MPRGVDWRRTLIAAGGVRPRDVAECGAFEPPLLLISRQITKEDLMDLIDRINELSARIKKQKDHTLTEEAAKHAFVLPFLSALGYDVFNPMEVIPELDADHGIKKGEKVDYAIKKDDKVIILIECKGANADLSQVHASQLYRYFSVTDARFGILTNGIMYRFFSDIDEPNKMDQKPFFVFNMLDFEDHQVQELKKFTKSAFDLDNILTTAATLKYTGAIKKILEAELENPSEPFVRFFAQQIYDGRITASVLAQFTEIVKEARKQFINGKVNERLKNALSASSQPAPSETIETAPVEIEEAPSDVVTTEEEIDAFNIVRAITREVVAVNRVVMRDTKSYCGVLLDDNNRKPLCRLHFNGKQKYIGLFKNKVEERIAINDVSDIFTYGARIKETVAEYDGVGEG